MAYGVWRAIEIFNVDFRYFELVGRCCLELPSMTRSVRAAFQGGVVGTVLKILAYRSESYRVKVMRMTDHEHRFRPLLAPQSIALIGGSPKERSVGNSLTRGVIKGGFAGEVAVVNPKYESVAGLPTVQKIQELSFIPDLAVLSVSSSRIEAVMEDAIKVGAKAAVIFDFCLLENDTEPRLLDRLKDMAREANFPVCGGSGMGYHNFDTKTLVSFQDPVCTTPGHIAALCHSGSVFAMLADAAGRYGFNLLTSQGQEINGSMDEYMDFALEQSSTRVLALFIEAVRDPERFVAALEKANQRGIPVVATKVGRTAASARLAATHSGAMAGDDTAFDAVCRRYGVLRTDDLDGLMAAAQIFALDKSVGDGALAGILDSGGLREQMIDIAEDIGLEFASLTHETVQALEERLDFGLEPVNPLDAAGLYDENLGITIGDCLDILESDPGVAAVAHEYFTTDTTNGVPEIIDAARRMPGQSEKPYVLTYSLGAVNNHKFATEMLGAGVPVINGMKPLLEGVKCAFDYRDFLRVSDTPPMDVDRQRVRSWRKRLKASPSIGETEVLRMLADLGVDAAESHFSYKIEEAITAANKIGYPVVLKTAVPGLLHKSDSGGVHLGIRDEAQLRAAHDALSKLGPEVSVAKMVPSGVEVAFGLVNDEQFGPVVMVSAGGILVEVLDDRIYGLAPFGKQEALRMLKQLKIWKLLEGVRGQAAVNTDQLAILLSRFSTICFELGDIISEMDVNPVIASRDAVLAVDAVLIPFAGSEET